MQEVTGRPIAASTRREERFSRRIFRIAHRYRGALAAMPVVFAAICPWGECENDLAIWLPAGVIFAAGLALRIWAQQHLHYRLRIGKTLTTTGPYEIVRNPIYIANTMICVALAIASEVLWLVPVALAACCLIYAMAVRHEEIFLRARYGDAYEEYRRRVARWIPRRPADSRTRWTPDYLRASLRVEAYNLLFILPFVLKEVLSRG